MPKHLTNSDSSAVIVVFAKKNAFEVLFDANLNQLSPTLKSRGRRTLRTFTKNTFEMINASHDSIVVFHHIMNGEHPQTEFVSF